MKLFLLVLLVTSNVKCQNTGNKQPQKKVIGVTKMTTLDSLQGTWVSVTDKDNRIVISNDTIYDFNRGKIIDKSIISLSTIRKKSKIGIDKNRRNGSFFISFSIDDNDDEGMCYWIDYLTATRLVLDYNGKSNGIYES